MNKNGSKEGVVDPIEVSQSLEMLSLDNDEEREKATRLFKLVAKYITASTVRMNTATVAEYFEIVPLCCVLQSNDTDDELAPICTNLLAVLAYTITVDKYMPAALDAIKIVANCPLWSARTVITEFLSVFVFHNMATIISSKSWVLEVSLKDALFRVTVQN